MKKTVAAIVLMATILDSQIANSQVAASMYNVNRNDRGRYDFDDQPRHNRAGRIVLATGLLVGGLAIGAMAAQQDYYISNTTVYGVGGVMTILATGLVLTSVNFLNKEINIACTGNGLGVSMCLNQISSHRKRL